MVSHYEANVLFIRKQSPRGAIDFLMGLNLIKGHMNCSNCQQGMELQGFAKLNDGFVWRCCNKNCGNHLQRISIRKGSFFEGSKLSLPDIFAVVFCYSQNKAVSTVCQDFKINK